MNLPYFVLFSVQKMDTWPSSAVKNEVLKKLMGKFCVRVGIVQY